jgi:transposase
MENYTQGQLRELETIGCDLGDKKSELFVIRPDETAYRPKALHTTRKAFQSFFEGRSKKHVVIEVGTHSRWVSSELEKLGHVVTVANPRKVKLISQNDEKDDEVDAELLARLGRADVKLLSPIRHRGDQVQGDLAIAKARDGLIQCRTKLVNQVRGLSKSFGEPLPKCDAACFHRKTKEFVPERLQSAAFPIYEILAQLAVQIAALDETIEEVAHTRYPDIDVVSQPKGVGVLTAFVFLTTLEDKERFTKSRELGPFLGLKPKKRKSGNGDPELRITKAGDPFLRRLLVQGANYILGPFGEESDLRRWGTDHCNGGGKTAKKKATVAVARKLAVLMHRLWVTGEEYQPIGYNRKQQKQRRVA